MASVIGTFVPTYQGLSATDFVRAAAKESDCFPFTFPHRLPFYRARNAIYHLFRALIETNPGLTVLAPTTTVQRNPGHACGGVNLRYCPVHRDMTLDPGEVERHCRIHNPDLLYVIHYAGWPQPMAELVDLCRRRGMLLVEDCALSLLSEVDGRSLGTFGDWSVFCLYKTLPLPNGALLVKRTTARIAGEAALRELARLGPWPRPNCSFRHPGRANGVARYCSRERADARGALEYPGHLRHRCQLDEVDLAMSRFRNGSERLTTPPPDGARRDYPPPAISAARGPSGLPRFAEWSALFQWLFPTNRPRHSSFVRVEYAPSLERQLVPVGHEMVPTRRSCASRAGAPILIPDARLSITSQAGHSWTSGWPHDGSATVTVIATPGNSLPRVRG